MSGSLAHSLRRIAAAPSPQGMSTRIIAIDGCGGAGKSTLAGLIAPRLGAQIVHTDDFASWGSTEDWKDRLMEQVLRPLGRNMPGRFQRYDWGTRALAEWHDVPVQSFVVLEGVSSMRAVFRPFLSFSIFVDAPPMLRLQRGLARDGTDALPQWRFWQAEEVAYLARETPQAFADLVLDGGLPFPEM